MRFPFPDVLKKGEGALLTSHIISVVKLSYKEIAGLYVCKPWLRANYLAVSKGNNDASNSQKSYSNIALSVVHLGWGGHSHPLGDS